MRKLLVFGICTIFLLCLMSFAANSASVLSSKICKEISAIGNIDDPDFARNVRISCDVQADNFTTEDETVFFVANMDVAEDDNILFTIYDPSGNVVVAKSTGEIPSSASDIYGFLMMGIAGKGIGTYTARLSNRGNTLVSKTFMISEPDYTCENNGYFCCPSSKLCVNKPDPKYVCTSGSCCKYAASCVSIISGDLSVRIIPDCVAAGLQGCDKVIGNVYDYSIHGALAKPATAELFFRDIDVDCFNKKNVVIGVYDEMNLTDGTSNWKVYDSVITKLAGNQYSIKANINYVGYIAVIKSDRCVSTDCFIPGFSTVPFNGIVNAGNPIKLGVCQITKSCDALANGVCNRKCTQDLDPDCEGITCTSQINDCCNPEQDKICDLDCALGMDPDCADDSYLGGLCYPSTTERRGFSSCDVHCTGADQACNSPGCDPAADGICNPNCPKLSNGFGYLDVDCCAGHGVSVTNLRGDCCNTGDDGVCDPDCIPGLDPDCNRKVSCYPNSVKESFEECDTMDFGAYSDCASYLGADCTGNLLCTTGCKIDTSGCQCTPSSTGDGGGE